MSLQIFFDNFALLADAPKGVAKLRELVLRLAVHGKLLRQSTSDEPASELLKRSRMDMAQRIAARQAKPEKPAEPVSPDEVAFSLPAGWAWCRLVDAAQFINGLAFKPSDWGNVGRPIIRIQNLSGRNPDYNRTTDNFDCSVLVQDGDILVSWSATLDAFIWRGEEGVLNQHIFRVLPAPLADKGYLFWLLKWVIRELAESEHAHGLVMSHINRGPFLSHPIPLPPLAEQKRIVTKVDELMALCGRLEAWRQARRESRVRLNNVTLAPLGNPASLVPGEFEQATARLGDNFDTLYDSVDTVGKLRSTILQLAVQGKLVPREELDEPLKEILRRVRDERLSLDLNEKDKARILAEFERVDELISDEGIYPVRIAAMCICDFITKGTTPSKTKLLSQGPIPFLKVYNVVNNRIDFDYKPTFISRETHNSELKRSKVYPNDVVMNIVGPPLGKVAIIPNSYAEWNLNQALAIFRPLMDLNKEFLYYALRGDWTLESVLLDTRGTAGQDNLSLEQCRKLLIPLYSPSHQARIVAKVNQLMALCDELETKLRQAEADSEKLMNAAVQHVLDTVSGKEKSQHESALALSPV